MSINIRGIGSAVIGLLALAGAATPLAAHAQQTPETHAVIVRYGDLHLDRASDVAVLYRRIQSAAESSCGEPLTTGSRIPAPDYVHCVDAAVRQAIDQVASTKLTAYYHRHTSRERRG